jgi:hypothetical protein
MYNKLEFEWTKRILKMKNGHSLHVNNVSMDIDFFL